MKNIPQRIYLNLGDDVTDVEDFKELDEITWSEDKCTRYNIPYVLEDKHNKMIEWIVNHDVGISSKTMWCALMNVKPEEKGIPRDADDFSRCYDLYKFCRLSKQDLQTIATRQPIFVPVVNIWDALCNLYESHNYEEIYEIISNIRNNK